MTAKQATTKTAIVKTPAIPKGEPTRMWDRQFDDIVLGMTEMDTSIVFGVCRIKERKDGDGYPITDAHLTANGVIIAENNADDNGGESTWWVWDAEMFKQFCVRAFHTPYHSPYGVDVDESTQPSILLEDMIVRAGVVKQLVGDMKKGRVLFRLSTYGAGAFNYIQAPMADAERVRASLAKKYGDKLVMVTDGTNTEAFADMLIKSEDDDTRAQLAAREAAEKADAPTGSLTQTTMDGQVVETRTFTAAEMQEAARRFNGTSTGSPTQAADADTLAAAEAALAKAKRNAAELGIKPFDPKSSK